MPAPANANEALAGRLLATAGFTAVVGQRLFPSVPGQDSTGPYAVYYRTAGAAGPRRLDGGQRLRPHFVRLDCYAATEAVAEAALSAARAALTGWQDKANGVHGCFPVEDADEGVDPDAGGGAFQVSGQSFELWYLT